VQAKKELPLEQVVLDPAFLPALCHDLAAAVTRRSPPRGLAWIMRPRWPSVEGTASRLLALAGENAAGQAAALVCQRRRE
jgi:hypothetical protein